MEVFVVSSMRIAALAGIGSLALACGAQARTYGGPTGQDDAIVLVTNSSGKRLSGAVMAFRASCESGQTFAFHDVVEVGSAGGGTLPYGELVASRNSGGVVRAQLFNAYSTSAGSAALQVEFSARTGSKSSRGSFSAELVEFDTPGARPATEPPSGAKVVDRCRTGTVRWSARHAPGRIYGGVSSQGEPVVLIANRNRSRLETAGVGWHADCTDQGFVDFPDVLRNFPIRRGRFGDVFAWRPEPGVNIAYDFGGSINSRTARGRLRVDVDKGNAATCSTGQLTWRASSR